MNQNGDPQWVWIEDVGLTHTYYDVGKKGLWKNITKIKIIPIGSLAAPLTLKVTTLIDISLGGDNDYLQSEDAIRKLTSN